MLLQKKKTDITQIESEIAGYMIEITLNLHSCFLILHLIEICMSKVYIIFFQTLIKNKSFFCSTVLKKETVPCLHI